MNKKMMIVVALAMCACAAFARPHGGFGGPRREVHGGHRPAPVVHHGGYHHHHSHDGWGRGGQNVLPALIGGVVGGVIANTINSSSVQVVTTSPVVVASPVVSAPIVAQPVYTTQQVWVPGTYVDQVQVNGTIVRVWVPGHYETRQVLVQ